MAQADRIAKAEETTRAAFEIIDAQTVSREAKTERLRKARLAAKAASSDLNSSSAQ